MLLYLGYVAATLACSKKCNIAAYESSQNSVAFIENYFNLLGQ
jgi:hypothetical protein